MPQQLLGIPAMDRPFEKWTQPARDPESYTPAKDPWGGTEPIEPIDLGTRRVMGLAATGYRWITRDRIVEAWVSSDAPEPLAAYHRLVADLGLQHLPAGVCHWPSIILERGVPLRLRIRHQVE